MQMYLFDDLLMVGVPKSVVTLEVKPWDDETDMKALEESVRSVEMEGLVWGASKLVPIGYGIRKLQITLVVGAWRGIILLSNISSYFEQRTSLSRSMTFRRSYPSLRTTFRAPISLPCRVSFP